MYNVAADIQQITYSLMGGDAKLFSLRGQNIKLPSYSRVVFYTMRGAYY